MADPCGKTTRSKVKTRLICSPTQCTYLKTSCVLEVLQDFLPIFSKLWTYPSSPTPQPIFFLLAYYLLTCQSFFLLFSPVKFLSFFLISITLYPFHLQLNSVCVDHNNLKNRFFLCDFFVLELRNNFVPHKTSVLLGTYISVSMSTQMSMLASAFCFYKNKMDAHLYYYT